MQVVLARALKGTNERAFHYGTQTLPCVEEGAVSPVKCFPLCGQADDEGWLEGLGQNSSSGKAVGLLPAVCHESEARLRWVAKLLHFDVVVRGLLGLQHSRLVNGLNPDRIGDTG